MLKSEVGESRRAPAESFLSAGARFRFRPSLPPVSIINLPQMGDFQLFLERLSGLILGDFGAKMGDLSDFSS